MSLGERIASYRKKAGYSQEGLAEQLGVSRQAVSKWETGEATPDAERIIALAKVLGVTTDALLLEREEPAPIHPGEAARQTAPAPEWLDHLPRHIGRLFREKGYIAGYIVAAQGLGVLLVGLLARFGFGSILSMQNGAWGMMGSVGSIGSMGSMSGMGGMSAAFRFPIIFADILCVLGGIVIIGGVALAIIWKKRGQQ